MWTNVSMAGRIATVAGFVAAIGLAAIVALLEPRMIEVTLLGTLALAALISMSFKPKWLIVATAMLAVFGQTVSQLGGDVAGLADDVGVVLCALVIATKRIVTNTQLKRFPGDVFFVLFAIAGFLSSGVSGAPVAVSAQGGYLAIKMVVFGWSVAQCSWTDHDLINLKKIAKVIMASVIIGAIAQLAAPSAWARIFATSGVPEYRGPFPSLTSFFVHPSFFGQVLALSAIAIIAWRQEVRQSGGGWLAVTVIGSLLTFRRKTILSLPLGILRVRYIRQRAAQYAFFGLMLLPLAVLFATPVIDEVLDNTYDVYVQGADTNARARITFDSIEIATDRFPFGAGFGRFGSATAFATYSPEYTARGYESIYGLSPAEGDQSFASDTFWPSVLGEAGWTGLAFYASALVVIWLYLRRASDSPHSMVRYLSVTGSGWLVLLLVESVAAPVLSGPPTYPFLPGLVGIIVGYTAAEGADLDGGNVLADSRRVNVIHRI